MQSLLDASPVSRWELAARTTECAGETWTPLSREQTTKRRFSLQQARIEVVGDGAATEVRLKGMPLLVSEFSASAKGENGGRRRSEIFSR
jgi:hypothetical protein